jgi:hypothetical protein
MKLSRFRRKSFTSMKKRKSTKRRRQTKRRPTKKFNIRKRYYMRGGAGDMLTLNQEDITALIACKDLFEYTKTKIKAGMGLEHIPGAFIIRSADGSAYYIYEKDNPDTYGTALSIYNSGRPFDWVKPEIISTGDGRTRESDRGFDSGR